MSLDDFLIKLVPALVALAIYLPIYLQRRSDLKTMKAQTDSTVTQASASMQTFVTSIADRQTKDIEQLRADNTELKVKVAMIENELSQSLGREGAGLAEIKSLRKLLEEANEHIKSLDAQVGALNEQIRILVQAKTIKE